LATTADFTMNSTSVSPLGAVLRAAELVEEGFTREL
jgi:hypothetical protein